MHMLNDYCNKRGSKFIYDKTKFREFIYEKTTKGKIRLKRNKD